jgi:hypothetical protein
VEKGFEFKAYPNGIGITVASSEPVLCKHDSYVVAVGVGVGPVIEGDGVGDGVGPVGVGLGVGSVPEGVGVGIGLAVGKGVGQFSMKMYPPLITGSYEEGVKYSLPFTNNSCGTTVTVTYADK